jgi:mitochondrial import inner membrane translocase subunit TIM22
MSNNAASFQKTVSDKLDTSANGSTQMAFDDNSSPTVSMDQVGQIDMDLMDVFQSQKNSTQMPGAAPGISASSSSSASSASSASSQPSSTPLSESEIWINGRHHQNLVRMPPPATVDLSGTMEEIKNRLNEEYPAPAPGSVQTTPLPENVPLAGPFGMDVRHLYRVWPEANKRQGMLALNDSCIFKMVISGVMGGAMGGAMGLLISSQDTAITSDDTLTTKQKLRLGFRDMGRQSWSYTKSFAAVGLIYSMCECNIEKLRAKHDVANTMLAGCLTGGAFGARAGPQAAFVGCTGFAAFSAVFEYIFS